MLLLLPLTTTAKTSKKLQYRPIFLTTANTVVIDTAITNSSVAQAKKDLFELVVLRGMKSYPLFLVLNSPGGSIMAGENFIRYAKTVWNLHTVSINAASMAHAIVQALPGKRYAVGGAVLMAHRAKVGISGQINDGELESRLRMIKAMVTDMETRNSKRIGISLLTYKSKVKDEWWTYGEENVKQNVVDSMANLKCSIELIKKEKTTIIRSIFGSVKIKKSACPLM